MRGQTQPDSYAFLQRRPRHVVDVPDGPQELELLDRILDPFRGGDVVVRVERSVRGLDGGLTERKGFGQRFQRRGWGHEASDVDQLPV